VDISFRAPRRSNATHGYAATREAAMAAFAKRAGGANERKPRMSRAVCTPTKGPGDGPAKPCNLTRPTCRRRAGRTLLLGRTDLALREFIVERDLPKVGALERKQLQEAAQRSNGALRQLGADIPWLESYVADGRRTSSEVREVPQAAVSNRSKQPRYSITRSPDRRRQAASSGSRCRELSRS
jgi:hypothetical protein